MKSALVFLSGFWAIVCRMEIIDILQYTAAIFSVASGGIYLASQFVDLVRKIKEKKKGTD